MKLVQSTAIVVWRSTALALCVHTSTCAACPQVAYPEQALLQHLASCEQLETLIVGDKQVQAEEGDDEDPLPSAALLVHVPELARACTRLTKLSVKWRGSWSYEPAADAHCCSASDLLGPLLGGAPGLQEVGGNRRSFWSVSHQFDSTHCT